MDQPLNREVTVTTTEFCRHHHPIPVAHHGEQRALPDWVIARALGYSEVEWNALEAATQESQREKAYLRIQDGDPPSSDPIADTYNAWGGGNDNFWQVVSEHAEPTLSASLDRVAAELVAAFHDRYGTMFQITAEQPFIIMDTEGQRTFPVEVWLLGDDGKKSLGTVFFPVDDPTPLSHFTDFVRERLTALNIKELPKPKEQGAKSPPDEPVIFRFPTGPEDKPDEAA